MSNSVEISFWKTRPSQICAAQVFYLLSAISFFVVVENQLQVPISHWGPVSPNDFDVQYCSENLLSTCRWHCLHCPHKHLNGGFSKDRLLGLVPSTLKLTNEGDHHVSLAQTKRTYLLLTMRGNNLKRRRVKGLRKNHYHNHRIRQPFSLSFGRK